MADIVKIENYNGTANTFTFPYNPQSYQESNRTFNEQTPVKYSNFHIFIGNRSLQAKNINFSGNFSLADKDVDYEDLARNLQEGNKLKKIYFRDDRFHIILGANFQKNHTNNRTNFIDYVFDCQTPIPLAFGSTLKESSYDGSNWTNGTETNEGGTFTYIEQVQFTLSSSASSGDTITINSDNDTGIKITLNDNYSIGEVFTLSLITYEQTAGVYQTKYWQIEDSSGNKQSRSRSLTKDELSLRLEKDERIDTYTITSDFTISDITFKFRDGFNGG